MKISVMLINTTEIYLKRGLKKEDITNFKKAFKNF